MTITNQLVEAFLQCPTKCYLRAHGEPPTGNTYADWAREQAATYRRAVVTRLRERLSPLGPSGVFFDPAEAISAQWRCSVDIRARSQQLETLLHAVERRPSRTGRAAQLVPLRSVRAHRPSTVDRLLLAFDALVLTETLGYQVGVGRIIHGDDQTSLRINTAGLAPRARTIIKGIDTLLRTKGGPGLVLNRHCAECEFQARCRQKAIEIDELSLFSGMRPEERARHRRNGIFTVHQLSYTFRPRRAPKRATTLGPRSFALQALALREQTIYVQGSPQLPDAEVAVYLDIEGLSTSGPYYLLGVLLVSHDREEFQSFWADRRSDETTAFTRLLAI
jgi:predicted RecB family nuclease